MARQSATRPQRAATAEITDPEPIDPTPAAVPEEETVIESTGPGWATSRARPRSQPRDDLDPSQPAATPVDDGQADELVEPIVTGRRGAAPATAGRSRASIAEAVAAFAPFFAGMAAMVGEFLHSRRTPGQHNAVWIMADEEMMGIGEPIARIVARRIPEGIAGDSDLGDGLQVAMVSTGYAIRSFRDEAELARTGATMPQSGPEEGAAADDAPRGPIVDPGGTVTDMSSVLRSMPHAGHPSGRL